MKLFRLHVWFVTDIIVLISFLINTKLMSSPLWIVLVLSNMLIGKGANFKMRIDKKKAFVFISFVVILSLFIFFGMTKNTPKTMLGYIFFSKVFVVALIFVVIFAYIKLIVRNHVNHGDIL